MTNILYPRNPARILTTAFKMAMSITLALARDRATGKARPLYFGQGNRIKGMAKVWNKAKQDYQQTVEEGNPDASKLLIAENNLRRSFSRILLKTSVKYGNTETKRVKREEGNKKYLNNLWDYSGSRLRDVTKARYFFSKPILIERDDGSSYSGYHGTIKTPSYPVRHNHIPELDFADMVRSPLMELARQCLKYGVPLRDAKKYIDALLFRLIPFMDYVYTGRRSGRPNYARDGLKELRIVVDQIKRNYGIRNGQRQSITSEVLESVMYETPSEVDLIPEEVGEVSDEKLEKETQDDHILQEAITEAKKNGAVLDEPLQNLDALLKNGTLNIEDSLELLREYQEQSRKLGVRVHRFVSKNFQSPFSFNGVVYHGIEMAYDNSGLILLSEVPVDGGRGRIDFVLARAKKLTRVDGAPSIVVCEPFMTVDLKTKNAFDFDIYGIESRTTDKENVVREFFLEHREMTPDEWENVLSNTPDYYEKGQLDAYEKAALTDYKSAMWKDADAQKSLVKAVLVVDSYQSWKDISEAILPLVLKAYNKCIDGTISEGDFLVPSDGDKTLRIAMQLLSVTRPTTETEELDIPIPLKPFKKRVEDGKEFVLYLTVPGRGSPSQSAASIAERWHGLEYVHGLARRRQRNVFWFDLVGEYTDPVLRKKQFRSRFQTDSVKRFFRDRVQVKDLSGRVREYIYEGAPISSLRTWIQNLLRDCQNPVIVVSGWESLRRSTPISHQMYLDEIVTTIIQTIPVKSTTVWFARPVPIAQNSITYSTRCVAPFYQGSLWQNIVDTIIWNVPMPPDRSGARISTNYHERGILIERPEKKLEWKIVEIKPLQGWGQDFQSGGRKIPKAYYRGSGAVVTQSGRYIKKQLKRTLEIIPHLLPHHEYNPEPHSNFNLDIQKVPAEHYAPQESIPRLTFMPTQVHTEKEEDGRVKPLLPITDINRRRDCRQMRFDVHPQQRTTRPPSEHYLSAKEIDYHKLVLTEIRHLKDTIKFLERADENHLKDILDQISEVLENIDETIHAENTKSLMNRLRLIRQILETNTLSKESWARLLPNRSIIPRHLTKVQRNHLTAIQNRHPDVLLITGNHLFLLILAALGSNPEIAYTGSLLALWDYVLPWHLIGLGLRPVYPKSHITGRSVLDRHRLLKRLHHRIVERNKSIDLQVSLTNVRFGRLIALSSSGAADSTYLWLLFQRTPGTNDMNAALLNPRGIDPSLSVVDTLHEMTSEGAYWSESDLNLLSWYARLQGDEIQLRIMVADLHGEQVFWIDDKKRRRWIPIGNIHYTTRRFENVTLVRTITLSTNPHLQSIEYDDVRRPIHKIEDMVDIATLILHKGLEGSISATCKVTLDTKDEMYRVIFTKKKSEEMIGELLINRTADLLEVLRRPDNECEPVMVNGHKLIWNRFKDILYDDDVALLRPWVNRQNPFPKMSLKVPPTARDLLHATKEFDITIEMYHDPWTCPLKHISLDDIQKSHRLAGTIKHRFLFGFRSSLGEPLHISNEPGLHHGSCWRIHIDTPHTLTSELREFMEVRLTDSQARSLLGPQELAYWSKDGQRWVTHTFNLEVRKVCIEEVKESWHLRMMLTELTGHKYDPHLPGVHLQSPDRWSPYFAIRPEYVMIGLREKGTGQTQERRVPERDVALRDESEVQKLLEREMREFLKSTGITADRRLMSEIQGEIVASIEVFGVSEDKTQVEFDRATIEQDSTGGRIVYVVLISELESHMIPVTGHLHDIRQFGRVNREDFVSRVSDLLDAYNLGDEDRDRAVKECVRVMRKEKLITR